ncbi:MAG: ABC transporter ATP-binding protein [Lentisphaerae bacterium]|jgi:ABC-2 type transport system ATP-binding protein|nr:ABC transporter ATP-binding protein [Lentisphaerota bacterium]MBT4816717.1 ABC transporter ATP-binding protein [Lentisphaerota bacterium]MBT5606548.1 ABC transporter ATP-binding protein [Lentisphaerota bacterium]MBT7053457.1 ABC transporter ATP-binding protein [Lentisphaerota bacterium]MBT7846800.1 ABC transporter ATP-binding protein [Lentisphaerota bacterium]
MAQAVSSPSGIAVEVSNLTKTFGAVTAVEELSFAVPEGQIAGFVGPNGSGKSTTLRILATLSRQDSGMASVMGMDVRMTTNRRRVRRSIGFMPDYAGLFPGMTAWEFLEFFAAAHRIPRDHRHGLIDDILALVDLTGKRDEPVEGLSRGMQQKLSLGRCLVHDPAILLLDEPASGLDPRARVELLGCLQELRQMGKTILISSHILGELEPLCDMLVIIERGKMAYCGSMAAAATVTRGDCLDYEVVVDGDAEEAAEAIRGIPGVSEASLEGSSGVVHVVCEGALGAADFISASVAAGVRIAEARRVRPDLERVFLDLTEG